MDNVIRAAAPILFISLVCAWVFNVGRLGEWVPFWGIPIVGVVLLAAVLRLAPPPARTSPPGLLERGLDAFALYGGIAGGLIFGFSSGWIMGDPIHIGAPAKAGLLLATVALASAFIPGAWLSRPPRS